MSAPNSQAQIDGHYGKLHSNYKADVLERPPDERPLSIIAAADPFELQYLPSQEMKRKDIKRLHVNQGKMVMFTNMCLHSGDTHESDEYRLRLFAYLVSHEEDFPKMRLCHMIRQMTQKMHRLSLQLYKVRRRKLEGSMN